MSSHLYWEPVFRTAIPLPYELLVVMRKSNLFHIDQGKVQFSIEHYMYFRALADNEVKGAQDVIDAIDKHGSIEMHVDF